MQILRIIQLAEISTKLWVNGSNRFWAQQLLSFENISSVRNLASNVYV